MCCLSHSKLSQCPCEVVIVMGAVDLPILHQAGAPSPSQCMCWLLSVCSSSFSRELFSVQQESPEAIIPTPTLEDT